MYGVILEKLPFFSMKNTCSLINFFISPSHSDQSEQDQTGEGHVQHEEERVL